MPPARTIADVGGRRYAMGVSIALLQSLGVFVPPSSLDVCTVL
jgi:hypothetical protein